MNILILNHYAGSPDYGMEFRPYYLAKEWIKQGHNVRIIGGSFSHLRKIQPLKLGVEQIDGITYYWVKTLRYKSNGIMRALSMFQFALKILMHGRKYLGAFTPDVVIASSTYPLDIYPARKYAKHFEGKLVYEVHDLWPLSPMVIGGYSEKHPFIKIMQYAENYAYKHADKVVSLLDKAFPHMQRHGLSADRFVCVPNGFVEDEWTNNVNNKLPDIHTRIFNMLKTKYKTIVGFTGGHTASTALNVLIDCATKLQTEKIAFVFVGQGIQKKQLQTTVQNKGLTNAFFLPAVSKVLIPKVVEQFDICYMGGVHSVLHQYGTSFNKMTDYMLACKPIVMSVDEPDSVVERVGCGLRVEAENPNQATKAILKIANLSESERAEMGRKGYNYAVEHLKYSTLANQFIQSIK